MSLQNISQITKDLYNSTPENVVMVGFGRKIVNGLFTDEISIIFGVKDKKPLSEIPVNEVLPSEINFGEVTLKTDVISYEIPSLVVNCPTDFYDWQTTPPANRDLVRPLVGGLSITNFTSMSGSAGTMGFVAVDNQTNSLVGVTNAHVVVDDPFLDSTRNNNFIATNVADDIVCQPSSAESGYVGVNNGIGIIKRYEPMVPFPGRNTVDGALFTLNEDDINTSTSYQQLGLTGWTQPLDFATLTEINNLVLSGTNLYSTGRTTGAKGEGDMKLLPYAIAVSTTVIGYENQGVLTQTDFDECIMFMASASTTPTNTICQNPLVPGDSGSCLIAQLGSERKIIGLNFAASTYFGYANYITNVESSLDISPYSGQTVDYSDTGSTEYHYVQGKSADVNLTLSGKTFWQVGLDGCDGPLPTPSPTSTPRTVANVYVSVDADYLPVDATLWYSLNPSPFNPTQPYPLGYTWTKLGTVQLVPQCNSFVYYGSVNVANDILYLQVRTSDDQNVFDNRIGFLNNPSQNACTAVETGLLGSGYTTTYASIGLLAGEQQIHLRINNPADTVPAPNNPGTTPTPTKTTTPTPTPTPTNTSTPTITPTLTNTPTNTSTNTSTPTATPTLTNTPTNTSTPTSTTTPSNTNSPTQTPTETPTVTPTPSITSSPEASQSPTPTNTETPTLTPTTTPSNTPSNTPSVSVSPSVTPTETPTNTPSNTPTNTPSVSVSPSLTPTETPTNTPTNTPSISVSPSVTPTTTPSNTPEVTPSNTPTNTPTNTPSNTPSPSVTVTPTISSTPTQTPSYDYYRANLENCCTSFAYEDVSFAVPRDTIIGVGMIIRVDIGFGEDCYTITSTPAPTSSNTKIVLEIYQTDCADCINDLPDKVCPTPTPTPTTTNTPTPSTSLTPTLTSTPTRTPTPTSSGVITYYSLGLMSSGFSNRTEFDQPSNPTQLATICNAVRTLGAGEIPGQNGHVYSTVDCTIITNPSLAPGYTLYELQDGVYNPLTGGQSVTNGCQGWLLDVNGVILATYPNYCSGGSGSCVVCGG
jgi:hypothetical protein